MSDVSATLAERGGRYGAFADHAKIAQGLIEVLHSAPNWSKLDPDMRQALHVIMDKTARILNGDPYYDDNWHDIQGYARLVEARIHEMKKAAEEQAKVKESNTDDNWEKDHSKIDWSKVSPATISYSGDQEDKFLNPERRFTVGGHDKSESSFTDVGQYRG